MPDQYVHEVEHQVAETLLKDDGFMEGYRERFSLRTGFPLVGAAIAGTHILA